MKPGDFLIGVFEFFAVLVPGALLAWLLLQHVDGAVLDDVLTIGTGATEYRLHGNGLVVAFGIVAYTLGYVVYIIGARLDGAYNVWRIAFITGPGPGEQRTWVRALAFRIGAPLRTALGVEWHPDDNYTGALALRRAQLPNTRERALTVYQWARTYVRIHDPASRAEIDRLEADSKLFRGLVLVFLIAAVLWFARWVLAPRPRPAASLGWAAAAVLLTAVAFWAYCALRWKMTDRAYAVACVIDAQRRPTAAHARVEGAE